MTARIRIDKDKKIIPKTLTGELTRGRSINVVREIALTFNTLKGHTVLIDRRDTEPEHDMMDLMAIAVGCSTLRPELSHKIPILNPGQKDRARFVQRFKACMETHAFAFRQFSDSKSALQWLTK